MCLSVRPPLCPHETNRLPQWADFHGILRFFFDMYMSYSGVSFRWKVTWQRNAEWRHSVRRPCDTMSIRRRAYRNTIKLIRSSVLYGTMYRVASICFCIFQRCTSHRTMYMTYCTTYKWIRHDSVKAEYDTCLENTLYNSSAPPCVLHIPPIITSSIRL